MYIVLVHRGQHRILVTRDSRLGDMELMTQGWVKVLETPSFKAAMQYAMRNVNEYIVEWYLEDMNIHYNHSRRRPRQ
jgi:hypothetical protein